MLDINCLLLNNPNTRSILKESSTEKDLFKMTIDYIIESNNNHMKFQKDLYKSLVENCNDNVLINEAFIDYKYKIKDIVSKFIVFVNKLWKQFTLFLNKFASSDKYINNNSSLLNKFSDEDNFDIEGYYFSLSSNEIPVINALAEVSSQFIQIDDINNSTDKKEYLKNKYIDIKTNLNDTYYDTMRARILGRENEKIYSEDYNDELFKIFRRGDKTERLITIKRKDVLDALDFFKNYKRSLKNVENLKSNIEEQYKEIRDGIDKILSIDKQSNSSHVSVKLNDIDDMILDNESLNYINLLIKAKVDQVYELSTLHSLAFSAKIDAYKSSIKQCKYILYKAIGEVIRKGGVQ